MHPLVRHVDPEVTSRPAHQRSGQCIALLAVQDAHAADVRREMTLPHEFCSDILVEARRLPIDQIACANERGQEAQRGGGAAQQLP